MYWCAASSGGDGELVQQKWLSILNHVTDVHEGHGDKFPRCQHGQLEPRDWMIKGNIVIFVFITFTGINYAIMYF